MCFQGLPLVTYLLLTFATLATSIISGVLSMAGGMILMGVFGFFLSVPAAMVLHGVAQTVSNGSRVWLHRRHLKWNVLIPYSVGSFIVLAVFVLVTFVPNKAIVFILIGSFPFIALILPRTINLDMQRRPVAFLSGLVVTTAQMLAGASGPVLDIFYVKSSLTRYEILGTKAITQTLGHILKLIYYAYFISLFANSASPTAPLGEGAVDLPFWIYPAVIAAAILGNWLGKQIIEKINDELFKRVGRYVIMVIGVVYIGKGIVELPIFN